MNFDLKKHEEQRINELKQFEILDSDSEIDFDEITLLASKICKTPISYISFIDSDRQWFKSTKEFNLKEYPREFSICSYALNFPNEITEIPDATIDERFKTNPAVIGPLQMVFYASMPLVTKNNMPIGTICVLDKKAKRLTEKQKTALKVLSHQVMKLLELRAKNIELEKNQILLQNKNVALENFTQKAMDTISNPINTINVLLDIINQKKTKVSSAKTKAYLKIIQKSSQDMVKLINEIKEYSKNLDVIAQQKETFYINDLFSTIKNESNFDTDKISYEIVNDKVFANKLALKIILNTIIVYSINNNADCKLSFNNSKHAYQLIVKSSIKYDEHFIENIIPLITSVGGELKITPKKYIELNFKKT